MMGEPSRLTATGSVTFRRPSAEDAVASQPLATNV